MNQTEAVQFASLLRDVADQVERDAVDALEIAHGWRGSLRAATYDPTGRSGHRHDVYDEDGVEVAVAVPHDPTGEAVIGGPPDRNRHTRLVAAMGQLRFGALSTFKLIGCTVPPRRQPRPDVEDAGEGWCASCWRIRWLSPEDVHADGRAKHKGLCSWCAAFIAANGCQPPDGLLRKRRDGKRISEQDVERALGRAS